MSLFYQYCICSLLCNNCRCVFLSTTVLSCHRSQGVNSGQGKLLVLFLFCITPPPPDPHNLGIRCLVNGDTVQSSNTDQMIFKTAALVAWVSKYVVHLPSLHTMASVHGNFIHIFTHLKKCPRNAFL